MEVTYEFETTRPSNVVKDYLSDPRNLMKYVPSFKSLKETENGWELQVSWMITVTLRVTMQQSRDEITYLIKKTEGLVKINSYLRFIILPTKDRTVVRLTFFYKGPFERVAKRQTEEFYRRGVEIFKRDLESAQVERKEEREAPNNAKLLLNMRTLLSTQIGKDQLDEVLEQAMLWSVNSQVFVLISDGSRRVELRFRNGDLESGGDLSSLGDKITVIVKGEKPD